MHGRHLEATINLKAELESVMRRCQELGIEPEGTCRPEVSAAAPARAQPSQQDPLGSGMFLFPSLSALAVPADRRSGPGPRKEGVGVLFGQGAPGSCRRHSHGLAKAPPHLMRLSTAWGLL